MDRFEEFQILRIKIGRQSAIFKVIKSKINPIRPIMILNHPTKGKVKRFDGNQVIIRKRKTDGQTDGPTRGTLSGQNFVWLKTLHGYKYLCG